MMNSKEHLLQLLNRLSDLAIRDTETAEGALALYDTVLKELESGKSSEDIIKEYFAHV